MSTQQSICSSGSFSSQRSSAKATALANLAAKRKLRNAARFENRQKQQQQPQPQSESHNSNSSKIDDTRQVDDPVGIDASTAYKLEEHQVRSEKQLASVGNEALILVYGYNPNLYEDVFGLTPSAHTRDILRSYQEQQSQLERNLATVFTADVPDDEINAALNESQMQAAISCGMTSVHMEQMHPRNFMEFKMDALKRAFDILKDEQSRIEYDAVLLEFQESPRGKLPVVVEDDEDDEGDEDDADAHDVEYGEYGDYSYDDNDTEEEDEDEEDQLSRTPIDNRAAVTAPHDELYDGLIDGEPYYPETPPQTLAKYPWKQEQQHSPRDPFDFDQQQCHQSRVPKSDNSFMSSRSTRSVHVDLFDPFDLQGADHIDYNHLPMVDEFAIESDDSVRTEEKEQNEKDDETVTTIFLGPLPKADDEDDDADITVGEVITARERGEEVVLPRRNMTDDNDFPNMVDFVPRKKKGIKPKLRSMVQSMKRSVGGSSKGSRSVTSDSNEFQYKGVAVMSFKRNNDHDDDPPQVRKERNVTSTDPLGPNLSTEEDDDDYDSVQTDDLVSELTRDTPRQQQGTTPQQRQQVAPSTTDLEVESFLNMANNFRAMDEENRGDRNNNTSMTPHQNRRNGLAANDRSSTVSTTTNKNEDYLKHYPMKSLVSADEESDDEDYDDDKNGGAAILDGWVEVIDDFEETFDETLDSISSICSCE